MRGLWVVLVAMIVLSLSVSAVYPTGEWKEYGGHPYNLHYAERMSDYTTQGDTVIFDYGTAKTEPLIVDFDTDGKNEVIVSSGSNVNIWRWSPSSEIFQKIYNINLGGTANAGLYFDDTYGILALQNNHAFVLSYDSINENISVDCDVTLPDSNRTITEPACDSSVCYWGGAGKTPNIIEFDMSTCAIDAGNLSLTTTAAHMFVTINTLVVNKPIIVNLDADPQLELIFLAQYEDTAKDSIVVADTSTLALDTGFGGGNGYVKFTNSCGTATSAKAAGITYTGNIIVTMEQADATEVCAVGYSDAGTTLWTSTVPGTAGGGQSIGKPVYATKFPHSLSLVGLSYPTSWSEFWDTATTYTYDFPYSGVCFRAQNSTTPNMIICAEDFSGQRTIFSAGGENPTNNYISNNQGGGDSGWTRIFSASNMFDTGYQQIGSYSGRNVTHVNHVSVGDAQNIVESIICFSASNETGCIVVDTENAPPEDNGDVGVSPGSPICNGTYVTFFSEENKDFTNDNEYDNERISTDCGNFTSSVTPSTLYSAYNSTNNEISCFMDTLGARAIRIYIEDEANEGSRILIDTVDIEVTNGTAGVTCNKASSNPNPVNTTITPPIEPLTPLEDVAAGLTDYFTGGSAYFKAFMAACFTIAFIFWLVKNAGVQNPIVLAICLIAFHCLLALLTFISWAYLFLEAVIMIAIALLSRGMDGK